MFRHLPNALTAFRLFAAPLLVLLLRREQYELALGIFALAGLSDALDGYLAKRFAFGSRFGAYLDPAADKLLMLAAFVTLALPELGVIPIWLTVLVIARDVAIVAGIGLLRVLGRPVEIAPLPIGKASTVAQVLYIGLILLLLALHADMPQLRAGAAILVAIFTAGSWLAYGQILVRALTFRRSTA